MSRVIHKTVNGNWLPNSFYQKGKGAYIPGTMTNVNNNKEKINTELDKILDQRVESLLRLIKKEIDAGGSKEEIISKILTSGRQYDESFFETYKKRKGIKYKSNYEIVKTIYESRYERKKQEHELDEK